MPLYECVYMIKAAAPVTSVAQTMKNNAQAIFEHGGVLRRLDNMGILPLAYPMYRHRDKHYKGRWIVMLFDGSPACQEEVRKRMAKDLTVFRWAIYKQEDVFRDKYDELYAHYGVPQGQLQHEMRKSHDSRLTTMLRLNEIHVASGAHQAIRGPSPVRSDSNKFSNENNLANMLKVGNTLMVNEQDVATAAERALQELKNLGELSPAEAEGPVDADAFRRDLAKQFKELDAELKPSVVSVAADKVKGGISGSHAKALGL